VVRPQHRGKISGGTAEKISGGTTATQEEI